MAEDIVIGLLKSAGRTVSVALMLFFPIAILCSYAFMDMVAVTAMGLLFFGIGALSVLLFAAGVIFSRFFFESNRAKIIGACALASTLLIFSLRIYFWDIITWKVKRDFNIHKAALENIAAKALKTPATPQEKVDLINKSLASGRFPFIVDNCSDVGGPLETVNRGEIVFLIVNALDVNKMLYIYSKDDAYPGPTCRVVARWQHIAKNWYCTPNLSDTFD
ncbi:hypothetical protein [Hymenobacter cellulosilyticus]|uniref:Uncharacterized protein n=1 Tax=Hymenobacter cellulosilyticus TaxID=2932248 RepID=A0A8T9QI34_9BACT|nr:hypothetical protein [Hymenobacter cellulosilyticus]UOQ74453.1 hypothetical protein MUN79_11575 [Hymenobacter cellulosilyticus]